MALTLHYDPAVTKDLVSVIGPTFGFTRGSDGGHWDDSGVWQVVGTDVPRYDHHQLTGRSRGLLIEGSVTNRALHSRDFTDAVWVATNITAAKDATGITADANSASTLTADAANGTIFQTDTVGSNPRTTSFYVKRKTGTGVIEITDDGGTNYTDITSSINSSTFTRVDIQRTQANPSFGFRIVTSGDEIEVDAAQVEIGEAPSSAIFTTSSTTSRSNDLPLVADVTDLNLTEGTWVLRFEISQQDPSGVKALLVVDDGSYSNTYLMYVSGSFSRIDTYNSGGDNGVSLPATATVAANTEYILAYSYITDDLVAAMNGSIDASADTAVDFPISAVTTIRLGYSPNTNQFMHGHIKEIRHYNEQVSDTQLIAFSNGEFGETPIRPMVARQAVNRSATF